MTLFCKSTLLTYMTDNISDSGLDENWFKRKSRRPIPRILFCLLLNIKSCSMPFEIKSNASKFPQISYTFSIIWLMMINQNSCFRSCYRRSLLSCYITQWLKSSPLHCIMTQCDQGSISPTYYSQFLHIQIPKTQKRQSTQAYFCTIGICGHKSCV